MSDLEKLAAIRARCVELLELASKRTPGIWRIFDSRDALPGIECKSTSIVIFGRKDDDAGVRTGINDAAFIASCAGPAEAGWRATIAAIDRVIEIISCFDGKAEHPLHIRENETAESIGRAIISAWEGQS